MILVLVVIVGGGGRFEDELLLEVIPNVVTLVVLLEALLRDPSGCPLAPLPSMLLLIVYSSRVYLWCCCCILIVCLTIALTQTEVIVDVGLMKKMVVVLGALVACLERMPENIPEIKSNVGTLLA